MRLKHYESTLIGTLFCGTCDVTPEDGALTQCSTCGKWCCETCFPDDAQECCACTAKRDKPHGTEVPN
jgi:hypothetical protein